MLHVDGYHVGQLLQETPGSSVYAGTRQTDGLRVVLKLYRGSALRAKRELEHLQRIEHPGVVRPVELRPHGDGQVLIVERMLGDSLAQCVQSGGFTVAEVVAIGLGVSHGLAAVHAARVIHKDLKPGNVLIDRQSLRTCVIDFGISAEFGRAEQAAPPEHAEGTLRYMAPEQTGRVGLGVDFRTDLYSLGVILYELLAGRPLFGSRDGLALINAHIAEQPRALVELEPGVPAALSRIVMKLLEKDPELRYQTARGLAADLEQCQKQLRATGEIDEELVLGSEDGSDRLRFPRQIYGRERECAELVGAFERCAAGSAELLLLGGPAGIGKSSLASLLQERLARTGGYLAEAKFDPELRERPYAGFAAAFTSWMDQILAERSDPKQAWRESIRTGLGAIGRVVLELAPNLAYIVDDFPALPTLPSNEARERLALGVIRFVQTVARPAHPLVLFLDDLQWADAGSLFLLGALLRCPEPGALLVLGTVRDDEVDPGHPLTRLLAELSAAHARIQRLTLAPLRLEDTRALLADALGLTSEDALRLARCVGPKVQHNPLLLRRLMFHLWDRNLIRHEHGRGWVWDDQRLGEAEITDDAAAMVALRIDALAPEVLRIVRIASLVGSVFEAETLVALAEADRSDTLQQLMSLAEQGLIAPCRAGFKFVHDRIREAAQSGFAAEERAALHHRAARLLLERTAAEDLPAVAFNLAEHWSGCLDRLVESERPRALESLFLAGRAALAQGAPGTAAHYLELARSLLSEGDWAARFEVCFALQLHSAEASFQLGRSDEALELLEALGRRPLDTLHEARVIAQRIAVYCLARPHDALDLTLAALRRFGLRWPRNPSLLRARLELLRTDWSLRDPFDRATFPSGPSGADLSWMAPILVFAVASGPMTQHSNRLSLLCAAHALRAFHRHGLVDRSPGFALATYATFRILIRGDLKGAERYARAATQWSQAVPHAPTDLRCRGTLEAYVFSWIKPRRGILEPLQRVASEARELGQLEWSVYALQHHVSFAALSGESLESVVRHIEVLRGVERGVGEVYSESYARIYALLRTAATTRIDWDAEHAAIQALCRDRRSADVYIGVQWIAVLCIFGELERAATEVERLRSRIAVIGAPGSRLADYTLFRGLCRAALLERCGPLERLRHLGVLRSCIRRLRTWARLGPDFAHMAELLQAELLRVRGRPEAALRRYQDAAALARKAGYLQHAALCHERRAALLARARRASEAEAALATASELYAEWGAHAKVQQLEELRRSWI
jgi:tetratricopeptide (TPR) repeat protein